jgi:hypothetical protein
MVCSVTGVSIAGGACSTAAAIVGCSPSIDVALLRGWCGWF